MPIVKFPFPPPPRNTMNVPHQLDFSPNYFVLLDLATVLPIIVLRLKAATFFLALPFSSSLVHSHSSNPC